MQDFSIPSEALPLDELANAFRRRAAGLAAYAPAGARAFEEAAALLEASLEARMDEVLTVGDGARERNWSYEGLRRLVKKTEALNAGSDRRPRIRRRDLLALGPGRGARGGAGGSPDEAHSKDGSAKLPNAGAGHIQISVSPEQSDAEPHRDRNGKVVARAPQSRTRRGTCKEDNDPVDATFRRIIDRAVNG